MKVTVFDNKGAKASEQEIDDALYGITVKKSVIHQTVVWQMAKRRAGTASTKGRADVVGTGKKPWRQKGTGRARAGSVKSPLWRKGGTVHGPKPKDWSTGLPKRVRKLAVQMALANRAQMEQLSLIDGISDFDGKTKTAKALIHNIGQNRVLFVTKGDGSDAQFAQAINNIPNCKVLPEVGLNVYDILNHTHCVIEQGALETIEARLSAGR